MSTNQQRLLTNLSRAKNKNGIIPDEIDPYITGNEFSQLAKKSREMTASSPSSIHIGYYIACAASAPLAEAIALSISIPFVFGFTHQRWNNSVHHMLEKTPGVPNLQRLRIIQLIEADFNLYQKIKIYRQLLQHA